MSNLIPLKEAAKLLRMKPEELTQLRMKSDITGVRDGSEWKFKIDELRRFAGEHGITLGGESGGEEEDLEFELSSGSLAMDSSDEVILKDSDSVDLSGDLKDSGDLSFGTSDIALVADNDAIEGDEPAGGGTSDTGPLAGGSGAELLKDKPSLMSDDSMELGSDFDESDMVLDDSDSSSEVVLEANDSGINLSPTDSGISLEDEPLELGGSDIDSLELPEDDDAIALEDAADDEAPTEMKGDDDFNLTPLEESLEDSSSSSQVIALEDSELFTDDSVPTMLADSQVVEQPALIPDEGPLAASAVNYPSGAVAFVPETPYTAYQIASLAVALLMTGLCAIIAFDVARHIWQGAESPPLTSTVMNFFLRMIGWEGK